MAKRAIEDVLWQRLDLSQFLVHLTKSDKDETAKERLTSILACEVLLASQNELSDARFRVASAAKKAKPNLFRAVCFTETPLSELKHIFDIAGRKVNLEPYGLVFLKKNLAAKGVSPVIYLNNSRGDKKAVVDALISLKDSHPKEAQQILPLLCVFGEPLIPGRAEVVEKIDFTWEREWRWPVIESDLFEFSQDDVLIGLCPNDEVSWFEKQYRPIEFIDPRIERTPTGNSKMIRAARRVGVSHKLVLRLPRIR